MSNGDGPGGDTREAENEFWYQFDQAFNPDFGAVSDEVRQAYRATRGPDFPLDRWKEHRALGTYPDGFRDEMTAMKDGLLFLADLQLQILDEHLKGDAATEVAAFVDFGQGVLFDDRRPAGDKIHKMDTGGPDNPPIGYHRWHGSIRAVAVVGGDADRWLRMDRLVGLAWAVQSEAKPQGDEPDNTPLPADRVAELTDLWMGMSFVELDEAFDSEPYPPGVDASNAQGLAPSGYDIGRNPVG